MKTAIFGTALAATFVPGSAARRDCFVTVRANADSKSRKELRTKEVLPAAPCPGLRPFRTLVNGYPGAKIFTDSFATSPVGQASRLLFGGATAGHTA